MGAYDRAERQAIKFAPVGFLLWLLVGLDADLVFARWLETQSPGAPDEQEMRSDLVAELVSRSGTQAPWACLVEAQGQQQADLLVRVLQYMLRWYQELRHGPHGQDRYLMMAAIVNLDDYEQENELRMGPPVAGSGEGGSIGLRWKVWVRNVLRESAAETLAQIAAGKTARCLLPWLALMIGGDEMGIIEEWKCLAEVESSREMRANYAALALVFAEKVARKETWRKALEGWDVEESQIINEWVEKGVLKARRDDLMQVLHVCFSGTIPDEVAKAVKAQNDLEVLSRWFKIALAPNSPAQLQEALTVSALRSGA